MPRCAHWFCILFLTYTASAKPQWSISAGYNHSVAIRADGTVAAWGLNTSKQTTVPSGLTDVMQISAGGHQSLALKKDGTIVHWGDAQYTGTIPAALQGNTNEIASGGYHALAQKKDSSVVQWGGIVGGMANIPTYKVAKAASGMHTMAVIKVDSTVYAWGLGGDHDYNGTVPADLRGVVEISVGRKHILAITRDNTVVVWGDPSSPEVRNTPPGLKAIAVAGGDGFSVAVKMDGTVVQWGTIPSGVGMPANLTGIIAVTAGRYHVLALKADGTLYAWGNNSNGQCTVPAGKYYVGAVAARHPVSGHADFTLNRAPAETAKTFDLAGRLVCDPTCGVGRLLMVSESCGGKSLILRKLSGNR